DGAGNVAQDGDHIVGHPTGLRVSNRGPGSTLQRASGTTIPLVKLTMTRTGVGGGWSSTGVALKTRRMARSPGSIISCLRLISSCKYSQRTALLSRSLYSS